MFYQPFYLLFLVHFICFCGFWVTIWCCFDTPIQFHSYPPPLWILLLLMWVKDIWVPVFTCFGYIPKDKVAYAFGVITMKSGQIQCHEVFLYVFLRFFFLQFWHLHLSVWSILHYFLYMVYGNGAASFFHMWVCSVPSTICCTLVS